MKKSFESYLRDRCPCEYQTNNSQEGEDRWLEQLDGQELIDFGEVYGEIRFIDGQISGLDKAKEILRQ